MIKKINIKIKKSQRSNKNYLKIKNNIDQKNLTFKLDSEEKLDALLQSVNKFMVQRLEAYKINECLTYFLQNMKRYRVLTSIMEAYSINANATYKEEIIKALRVYSYKTISNIIDDALSRGYIKYVDKSSDKFVRKKIKTFRPSSSLVSNYLNWTLQHVGNFNKMLKNIN
jgi:hypothetical protein